MWTIEFENGDILHEQNASCWDNVPSDKKIIQVAFVITDILYPFLLFKDFDKICIAKLGSVSISGDNTIDMGYVITEIRSDLDMFVTTIIRGENISTNYKKLLELTVPDSYFRKSVRGL